MDSTGQTFRAGDAIQQRATHSTLQRILAYLQVQISQFHFRILLVRVLLAPLPRYTFGPVRAIALRLIGFKIGRKSVFYGMPKLSGQGKIWKLLKIGQTCSINTDCYFDLSAPIVIGDKVGIAPEVMIMTTSHDIGPEDRRAGPSVMLPVTIEDGVFIGARCLIMPGVTIGRGSVISAGSTVNRNVPPNTIIMGEKGMPIDKWMMLRKNSN